VTPEATEAVCSKMLPGCVLAGGLTSVSPASLRPCTRWQWCATRAESSVCV
jgi:hypothetical protein